MSKGKRICVFDVHKSNRHDECIKLFNNLHLTPTILFNEKEMMTYAKSNQPDICMVIVSQAGGNWDKIIDKLQRAFPAVPIVAAVEPDAMSMCQRLIAFGVDDFIKLPFDEEELKARIHKLSHFGADSVNADGVDDREGFYFRLIADTAKDAIFIKDKELRYLYVNPAWEKLFRVDSKNILGLTDEEIFWIIERNSTIDVDKQVLDGHVIEREHTEMIDGEVSTYDVVKVPVYDIDNKFFGICGISRDMSDRKKMEDALRESENGMRTLIDVLPIGIYYIDQQGNFLYGNQKAEQIIGYKKEELVGKNFVSMGLLDQDDLDIATRDLLRNLGGERTGPTEHKLKRKDGRNAIVEITASPIVLNGENVIIGMVNDITRRIKSVKALQESEEKYKNLVEKSEIAILIDDIKGRFKYFNEKFADLLGYSCSEMNAESIKSLVHPDDKKRVLTIHSARVKGKNVENRYEFKAIHKNGSTVYLEVDSLPHWVNNKIVGTQSFIRDVTEKKMAELAQKRHLDNLGLLSETALALVDMPSDDDIFQFIAKKMSPLVKDAIILVSTFDEETMEAEIRSVQGMGRKLEGAISKVLGYNFKKQTYILNDKAEEKLIQGELIEIGGGIHKLSFETISPEKSRIIENLYGVGEIWGAGFTRKSRLLGTVVIILKEKQKLKNRQYIEALINQASVALQRRYAEDRLRQSEQNYRTTLDAMGESIHVVDENMNIVLMNRAFLDWNKQLGLEDKVFGKNLFNVFPFLGGEVRNEYENVFTTGKVCVTSEQTWVNNEEFLTVSRKIPVFTGDRVTGVVTTISDETEEKYNEDARQISFQIANAMNNTRDIDELFMSIRDILGSVMDTRNFFIALYDEMRHKINLPYFVDEKDNFKSLPGENTLTSYVIESGASLLLNSDSDEVRKLINRSIPYGSKSKSWLGVPLRIRGEVIGAVVLQSYDEKTTYRTRHQRLLEFVSDQIAVAIDRRRAEDALRESEEKYSNLFYYSNDGIFIHDTDGEILDVNQQVLDMFGYKRSDILRMTIIDLHPPEAQDLSRNAFKDIRKHGYVTFEILCAKENGSTFWAEVPARMFEVSGKSLIQGIIRDITERRKAQDQIAESERRYREIFENASDALFLESLDGDILDVNASASRILGYTRKELTQMNVSQIIPDEYLKDVKEDMTDLIPHDCYVERRNIRKDGKEIWVEVIARKVEVNGILRSLVMLRDISERKRAQEALQRSNLIYRRSIENAQGVPYQYNYVSKKYDFIAEGLGKLIGIDSIDIEPDIWRKIRKRLVIKDPEAPSNFVEYGKAFLRGEIDKYKVDFLIEKPDGEERWISDNAVAVKDENGLVVASLGIIQDITDRKLDEEKLRESEKRYRSLYNMVRMMCDNVPDMIWAKDLDRKYIFANKAICDKLLNAKDTEEPVGKSDIFFAKRERESHEDTKWHTFGEICADSDLIVMDSRRPQRFDEYGNVGGEFLYLDVYKAPFLDENNKMIGTVGCGRIVTEEKQNEEKRLKAEAELKSVHEVYRRAIENTRGVPYLRNYENDKYDFLSDGIEELTGVSADKFTADMLSRMSNEIIIMDPDAPDKLLDYGRQFRSGERAAYRVDQMIETPDGKTKWISDHAIPIHDEKESKVIGSLGILVDITARKMAEQQLQQSRERMRRLAGHLQSVREEERTLIAREIHDELGQALTALKMELHMVKKKLPQDEPYMAQRIQPMSELIESTIRSVKRISAELRPTLLDDLGLSAAIEWQTDEFMRRTGIDCRLTIKPPDIVLDKEKSTAIFRIFQETLTNVVRHANATKIVISLIRNEQSIKLRVNDNGVGIEGDVRKKLQSFGILGMQERAYFLGGELKIKSAKNKGTTITVIIPLSEKEVEND
ncbi:MAG: PAS domain S-box protein [candidate division KSB1 bacterium]|jgi:PAS domain S-box-containing protein|nr:PAS domain S-box protein [candidate division KSB1 bacterium]